MWILLEQSLTKEKGREIYFKGWEDYIPATTSDLQEAHEFKDKQEAKMSAAYRHRNSSFVPIEIQVVKSKAAA